jgi:O-antigen ligase
LLFLIPAAAITSEDLAKMVKVAGLAGMAVILMGLLVSDVRAGRLELSGAGASIENSNDYAALLILVMPAIAYLTMRTGKSVIMKLIGFLMLGLASYLVLGTGSRGALIAMIISLLYVLKAAPMKVRIGILVGLPVAAMIGLPFLPAESKQRLSSLFNSKAATSEAAESQMERTALLMESIRFTLQHPIIGVGPGTFTIYQAQSAEHMGLKGMWHETHNSYTQISSECGIPAVVFYLTAIVISYRRIRRGVKSRDPKLRGICQVLSLMTVSFAACMFFLSQGYGFGFIVLGAFSIIIERLRQAEEQQALPASQEIRTGFQPGLVQA